VKYSLSALPQLTREVRAAFACWKHASLFPLAESRGGWQLISLGIKPGAGRWPPRHCGIL